MKKKILFVIDSLDIAGAEKSLVTLLNLLDFSKYEVDLMLFAHGHQLEKLVPEEVTILHPLAYTTFSSLSLKQAFIHSITKSKMSMLSSRIKYSFDIRRKNRSNSKKAKLFWEYVSPVIEENPKDYDVAISYAQGVPTFYVAEKVTAKQKLAWVNVSYRLNEQERAFQRKFYDQFDQIVTVSNSARRTLLETFPYYEDKTTILYDINNPDFIAKMAESNSHYEDTFNGIRILTIGRLAYQKGYDIAIEACRKLKEQGIHFRWYVLGKGPLQSEIEELIIENDLVDDFVMLGVKSNPYPYIKNADIYVQTSRYEGFGLAIAEARMLNKPIVTTTFDAVYNQMIHEKNGLVVEQNADAVSEGIKRMINDKGLREEIIAYLRTEKKGNVENMENFYHLIDA